MHIRVVYQNDSYDYVTVPIFEDLLLVNKIKKFYRYSEERWVQLGVDHVRGSGGSYNGTDRRKTLTHIETMQTG